MKKICTLLTALTIGFLTQAQEVTSTATASWQSRGRGEDWQNRPGPQLFRDVQFDDNVYAYASLDFTTAEDPSDTTSEYMILTDFNLGIPTNAIIGRIQVDIWGRSDEENAIYIKQVQLVNGIANNTDTGFVPFNVTFAKRASSPLLQGEANESAFTFGGAPAAYWGAAITPAQLNSEGFGVAFQVVNTLATDDATAYIDSVSITVIYQAGAPLPVTFISVSAKPVTNGTLITWKVADEIDVKEYEVERSDDGARFSKIGSVGANGNDTYTFTDVQPIKGAAFYRIKNVDLNGDYKYSTIITLRNGGSLVITRAYPLPARGNLTLQHNEAFRQSLITISSLDGKMVKTQRPSTGSIQTDIDLSGMQSGVYLLRYDDGRGQVETLKIVKQ